MLNTSLVLASSHDQRMIAPLAFVVDVDAFLALAVGGHHRAVHVKSALVEKRLRLLGATPSGECR